ncbi:hypoxic response protein Hrp1 [Acrocarpospora macrocephala]|uniref:Hypoxic response protein 1 n=1 Tax=Acrocarpospora macrocephala TaxID=150177 RepID=A0A5M3WQI5_9ACTN|nr:CBS domain-containing protein [Acrocarpospora macrocephala]GES10412.1 hypoxic response protein 1 [Acrocarpospora macrocephala]
MTTAREIMHFGCECVGENETLDVAAKMMREMDVGALPVCGTDDRLKGIITDRDIVVRCIAAGHDPAKVRTGDLTEGTLVWVNADADVDDALTAMQENQIRRLPVLENHRLVGMISEADLAAHLPDEKLAMTVGQIYAQE